MRIGVLSRKAELYSTRRLVEAGEARGHEMRVINYLRGYMTISHDRPGVVYQDLVADENAREEELEFDAIIPRIGASYTFYGTALVRQFEMMGVFSANESQAITRSRDKLRAQQLLARARVDQPITAFAHDARHAQGLIDRVGGAPLIVKLLEGTQGRGVVLAETRKAAESVIGAFRQLDANILVQEFIREAGGQDLRVMVIDGKVVAAMERHAAPGEFRANLHQGGNAVPARLTAQEKRVSIKAARTLGLNVAGVDLLRSHRGPLVLEVNSSPGLEGIEKATGKDVAAQTIAFLERRAPGGSPKDRIRG